MTSVAHRLHSIIHSTPIRRVSAYKQTHSLQDRELAYQRFAKKYPDRLPVVADQAYPIISTESIKLSLPRSSQITFSKLLHTFRTKLELSEHQAIYIFIIDQQGYYISPSLEKTVDEIYDEHRDEDGMLYLVYSLEATYGTLFFK